MTTPAQAAGLPPNSTSTPVAEVVPGAAAADAAKNAADLAAASAAQAPAEKAKEPIAPLELEVDGEASKDGKTFTFDKTNDTGLDLALEFVGKQGFGPGDPALMAAVQGDFSILRAKLAEKNVPGSEAYIVLAEKAYEKLHAQHEAQRTKDKEELHKAVGGEESWSAITTWAKANSEPAEAEAINGMLGKGGVEMKIAASYLANQYQAATGGLPEGEGSGPRVADTNGAPVFTNTALSPQEYGQAVAVARQKHRGNVPFEQSKDYADLRARRERFKG